MKRFTYFQTPNGAEPALVWMNEQEEDIQAKIDSFMDRLAAGGSQKNIRSVGDGVLELKINSGPGYRFYFGYDGKEIIVILTAGTKQTQFTDIVTAKKYWRLYVQKQ